MCGIAGYRFLSAAPHALDEIVLNRVQQSMSHRGPDGFRIWHAPDKKTTLVHRRLSIVDLSQAGFQPLFDEEKSIAVICNGELYNHPVLRKELEAEGYRFSSNSDTETILYAYKKWGIACLDRLEGDFAIVIVDMRTNELYLVRDRIGVKPLYFSLQNGVLSFSSEIKALWPLPWIEKNISVRGVSHYLTYMVTPAPLTLYEGIYKLPAGFYLKADANNNVSFKEWYNPLDVVAGQSLITNEAQAIDDIESIFSHAVNKRLMSDVPLGSFLSGGIDSSLIVAHMSRTSDMVKTFNVSFSDGPEYSEVEWARKVATQFKTDHHEITISEKEAFEFFQSMVYHQDEPLADCVCIPLYFVAKLLRDSGVTVVLVGEGSDELFCGYTTYAQYVDTYNKYWSPATKYVPGVIKTGVYGLAKRAIAHKPHRLSLVQQWAQGRNLFWSGAIAFPELLKKEVFDAAAHAPYDSILQAIYPGFDQEADSYAIVDYHLKQVDERAPHLDFLNRMIYLEMKQRLPELLLMRLDKMAMATSVEGRVPFLDHELVEYAFRIPQALKYKNGITKYILKKVAERSLPQDVVYRKKVGFAAPTMRWFKEGSYFKPYFQEMLVKKRAEWGAYINFDAMERMYKQNAAGQRECAVQLWTLQNLIAGSTL
ncbi:MAG TPA: asparagine synthase (glutamine-hydrolyzing) [Candidatus Babeliales bacterium]|nr:asparagine synthase (glutamine-hydrolyzing) [Candidatus Babeliales bacterium]